MALNEISEQLHIGAEKLREYEANGLLGDTVRLGETSDIPERFIDRICLINFLLRSGMAMDELKSYLHLHDKRPESRAEQIRMLRKQRCILLEEIHDKQRILDELDYMIREIKTDKQH